ncbi:organic cation transporter protein-like isoform X2 [Amphiura filiformis]|uniref:organic cation transporter protein-like isoform X2 n=1 Tax=Amphiura filiformis TaxID=82378 RepID=UPI003B21FA19
MTDHNTRGPLYKTMILFVRGRLYQTWHNPSLQQGSLPVHSSSAGFLIATEYVGPSKRTLVGVLMADAFALGYMLLAVLAYFIRDWQTLELIISVPVFLLFAFIPLFPESARWLLTRGEIQKAKPILEKAAKCGKVTIPLSLYDQADSIKIKNPEKDAENEGERAPSYIDILRYPNVRWRTLNMMFNWFVNNMVYYGISLSTASLGGNEFVAAFCSAAVEIPAYTSSLFEIEKWGRRVPLCVYLIVGGVACIATIWIPLGAWRITVAMIGKFSLSASYGVVYIYAAELFPTPVRSIGLGLCCMASHLSGIVTPMILSLGLVIWAPLPLLIFGVLSIIAALLALLFPETMGQPLQETMEESEAFGKKKKHDVEQKPPSKTKDGVGYDRISMDDINEEKKLSNGGNDDHVQVNGTQDNGQNGGNEDNNVNA